MNYADLDAITTEMAAVVREAIGLALAPLSAEIATLKSENASLVARLSGIEERDFSDFAMKADIPAPLPDPDLSGFATKDDVAEAIKAIPPVETPDLSGFATKDEVLAELVNLAADIGRATVFVANEAATKSEIEALRGEIPSSPDLSEFATKTDVAEVAKSIPAMPEPQDLSGFATKEDVERVKSAIPVVPDISGMATREEVEAVRAAIPPLVEPKDFAPEISALAARVEAIKMPDVIHGKDGAGVAEARQNADGELIVKLTNGETLNAGNVRGSDGFGFDDLTIEDGEREFAIVFAKGDRTERFTLSKAGLFDRGVWREGEFKAGDGVTWAGSFWIAQRDTTDKPETSDAWRLAVKRGRDGKPGASVAPRPDTVKR